MGQFVDSRIFLANKKRMKPAKPSVSYLSLSFTPSAATDFWSAGLFSKLH
jgi:hypothetical protein